MPRTESDPRRVLSDPDGGGEASGEEAACACQAGPCSLYSEAHAPWMEECVVSDPQGGSDADADIEDTDCRLQEPGPLQRISSRRRKRPRVARQDTTESEDDGGRSCRTQRWPLRLSPARARSRTIPEESVSQVRPLVILRPDAERPAEPPRGRGRPPSSWPPAPSLPLALLLLLPLGLVVAVVIASLLRPRAGA
ncbi:uncharacterized protein AB9W97_008828 isoform 2-T2 [Spinachia spinachia]